MTFLRKDKSKLDLRLAFSMSSAGGTQGGQEQRQELRQEPNAASGSEQRPENANVAPSGGAEKKEKTPFSQKLSMNLFSAPSSRKPSATPLSHPASQRVPSSAQDTRHSFKPSMLAASTSVPEPSPTSTTFGASNIAFTPLSQKNRDANSVKEGLGLLLPVLLSGSGSLDHHAPYRLEIRSHSSGSVVNDDQQNQQNLSRPNFYRTNTADNYLPRLLVVLMPQLPEQHVHQTKEQGTDENVLKNNYRGFHGTKAPQSNVPPLSQPIKPRFRKKGSSLLNKLIHSNRKDSEPSDQESSSSGRKGTLNGQNVTDHKGSTSSSGSKHKFRLPSISLHHHHHQASAQNQPDHATRHASISEESSHPLVSEPTSGDASRRKSASSASGVPLQSSPSKVFDLDLNFDEMQSILRKPDKAPIRPSLQLAGNSATDVTDQTEEPSKHAAGWQAPDSWDVTGEAPNAAVGNNVPSGAARVDQSSESDLSKVEERRETARHLVKDSLEDSSNSLLSSAEGDQVRGPTDVPRKRKTSSRPSIPKRRLPILFGTWSNGLPGVEGKLAKGPNHIVRVFKEDNTFTTILCPLETNAAELLRIVQRKFFFESISNYHLALYVGRNVKVLEPFEKPLKIQMGLLSLSGYSENDNFRIIGREDLSFVCKLVVENKVLRNLTHEEESVVTKDYVDVDISSLDLKTIPIIFHQHTYEIEKLNVSDNPAIYIPLDFIQSCTNLSAINFARNGCSKFPVNFLEATDLTSLNMEANFLDDIPHKFGHLTNLVNLKLNSNQLYSLPKSFERLTNLTHLNLSSNYFEDYPECINDLVNLQDLDLSYNDLHSIPDSIAKLSKLVKLNLCTNKLTGSVPASFKNLSNLKRLDIRYNQVSNVDVLGDLPNLEVVYASKNKISAFNDKMEKLRLLHFDRNPITNLEFEILLPMLTVLDLSKAKLTMLPSEFVTKIPHIEKLVLDKNHLVNLPDELGNLPRLTHLSLYGNNIQTLPASLGQLSSLQYLDLHSNNILSLPAEIWNLKNLSILNVASNLLSSFPQPLFAIAKKISSSASLRGDEVRSLEEANELNASAIKSRPMSLADSLLSLTLSDNRLSDDCFEAISLLIQLKSLNISYNDILEIPEGGLASLLKLTELYLSGNGLTKLPADDLEDLSCLRLLYLNNNKLSTIPAELSKLKNLTYLDVGSNLLRYNISNWPYDWNWFANTKLRYLNFSGNKRFEIKQSYVKNPETGEDLDSLLVLKDLKVLGLMDVTLTTPAVPDPGIDVRLRTASSELDNVGYGVSDTMGIRDHVSFRDVFMQKFRGNENELLMCSFDGKTGAHQGSGHLLSFLAKQFFVPNFTNELNKIKSDNEIKDAMRRAFLSLNKEINSVFAAKKGDYFAPNTVSPELAALKIPEDSITGCSMCALYIKDKTVYCGNIGDIQLVLSKSNGEHVLLTTNHDPTSRDEFERIRACGGYVSGDGALDGTLQISRGVGFFDYLPHTHSGPSITTYTLSGNDDVLAMGTRVLWDYISYDLAVDILRQSKEDPMIAAQKLRDYAVCYGATDKISVNVISIGDRKSKKKKSLFNNLGREADLVANRRRRDRGAQSGDTALRALDNEIEPPVGDLALVFTDIKNSTLLWDTYPVAMRSAIKLHNTIMRRQLRIVGGYEVKTEGDSFMVTFPSPTSALLWCFNVQYQLLNEEWPSEILETNECCEVTDNKNNVIFRGLSVRMGIHWGSPVCELDMVTRRMDYFGPMVNRASRIESSADGGQIAVSSDYLHEMEQLYNIHEMIKSGNTSLEAAYEGNLRAGEIIEKEIASLEEIGVSYFPLGERKLKGLETPEMITLAYPKRLELRFEIFKKRADENDMFKGRIVGAVPVDAVYQLRTLSLRLENICAAVNVGMRMDESFLKHSSEVILESTAKRFKEMELVALLNHLVTRIENSIANLELRQTMLLLSGGDGRIDFFGSPDIWTLMDEVKSFIRAASVVQQDPH